MWAFVTALTIVAQFSGTFIKWLAPVADGFLGVDNVLQSLKSTQKLGIVSDY